MDLQKCNERIDELLRDNGHQIFWAGMIVSREFHNKLADVKTRIEQAPVREIGAFQGLPLFVANSPADALRRQEQLQRTGGRYEILHASFLPSPATPSAAEGMLRFKVDGID